MNKKEEIKYFEKIKKIVKFNNKNKNVLTSDDLVELIADINEEIEQGNKKTETINYHDSSKMLRK